MDTTTTATTALDALGHQLVGAVHGSQWGLAIGLALMLLIRVAGLLRLLEWIPSEGKRWLAIGLSLAGALATSLVGGAAWYETVLAGLQVGLIAIGSWELAKRE